MRQLLLVSLASATLLSADANAQFNKLFDLATKVVKATTGPSESDEIAMGQTFAATLLGAKPLLNNSAIQSYVNQLGLWLALQTSRPDLPWTFGVLDDTGFNAFATPGGNILITKGLLLRIKTEAELAGVLAHEIAHVVQKHHLNAMKKNALLSTGKDIYEASSGANPLAKEVIGNLAKEILAKGLDKSDEFEADSEGVKIAARAGFDPYGLPAVLQTLQAQSATDNGFELMFSTHPAPQDRLQKLEAIMGGKFEKIGGVSGSNLAQRLPDLNMK